MNHKEIEAIYEQALEECRAEGIQNSRFRFAELIEKHCTTARRPAGKLGPVKAIGPTVWKDWGMVPPDGVDNHDDDEFPSEVTE